MYQKLFVFGVCLVFMAGLALADSAILSAPADHRFPASEQVSPDNALTTNPAPSVERSGQLPAFVRFSRRPVPDIELKPRLLTLTVRSSFTNQPVDGVLLETHEFLTATASLSGQLSLPEIDAGDQITITAPGYLTTTFAVTETLPTEFFLRPARLVGVIRDRRTQQPLPQSMVYLAGAFFRADENGQLIIEPLPETPVQLTFKAAGYHRTYAQLTATGIYTHSQPPFAGVEGRWLGTSPCRDSLEALCLDFLLEPFQARAIYIPLHYMGSSKLMIDYLDFVAGTDHNAIVVDVKGDFGKLAWDSNVQLAADINAEEWVKPHWMPLEELVAEARARNIYTIARLVVFKDDPLAHARPEWAAVTADGQTWIDGEGLGWANPFKEEVWDYNIALAKEVAAAGFDELNFDYIRFPSDGNVGAIVYEEENTRESRTAAIGQFMTRLSEALQPAGVFLSADVFGLTIWVEPESDMRIGQRIIDIAPHIDYLAPMVYPSTFIPGNLGYPNPSAEPYGVVYRSQKEAEMLVPPYVRVRPWLQGYWYSLEEMKQLKQAAIDSNATGWVWWNAGGKYNEELFEKAGD